MLQPQESEVQISIPLRALVGVIDQLPTEALLQLLHAAEAALAMRADTKSDGQVLQGEEAHFWESELGQYIAAEADGSIAIEDVRQALSMIPGALSAEASRERDERYGEPCRDPLSPRA
jgi:hypothetical protein